MAPEGRFVYVPLMHEVLGESIAPPEVMLDIARIIPSARVVPSRALRVDKNEVALESGDHVAFDVCVVALGGVPNDFGVPGVQEHALTFQTLEDALRANAAVKSAVAKGASRIVVVGASFTGIEVAGEIHSLLAKFGSRARLVLMDALPDIFPHQSPLFRQRVREALDERGIELVLSSKIKEVEPGAVVVEGRANVEGDVVFWCAGVKPRGIDGVDSHVRATLQTLRVTTFSWSATQPSSPRGWTCPSLRKRPRIKRTSARGTSFTQDPCARV